jgi:hypothetical protein
LSIRDPAAVLSRLAQFHSLARKCMTSEFASRGMWDSCLCAPQLHDCFDVNLLFDLSFLPYLKKTYGKGAMAKVRHASRVVAQ